MSIGMGIAIGCTVCVGAMFILSGVNIVRPREKRIVERLGKFNRVIEQGFHWVIPMVDKVRAVNITEQMVDAEAQEIITAENLNASVDAQIYFKVKLDHDSIKKSEYAVQNYRRQIVALARTTLRNVIGESNFESVNSKRNTINLKVEEHLRKQTSNWGIEIVRVELQEITPPKDVQEIMNKVLKAENEKKAAVDFATAKETEADGIKRSAIKEAEGKKAALERQSEGEAYAIKKVAHAKADAIKLVNESAEKYFKGNAKQLKQLEVAENSLKKNSKVILGKGAGDILKLFDLNK